jgi:hypothetical protein
MIIRFSQFINEDLLIENRIEFLKTQHPTLDTSHDTLAKYKDAGDIIDHFAKKADPTPTKAHTQWIVNQYKRKQIRQEDAPQIKSTLKDFADVKDRLEKKDLNQYGDVGELRDAVATQKSQAEKATRAKKTAVANKSTDLEKMYDSDGVEGYKIPNKESSIRNYGPGGQKTSTHWCTAANSGNNMFNHYKGGKYTMHFPNGEVLQFHHQSNQIMDKHDHPVQESDPRFQPYEHHISKFIHQTKALEGNSQINRFVHHEPHEIQGAIDDYKAELGRNNNNPNRIYHHSDSRLKDVTHHAKLSDSHFDQIHALPVGKDYADRPVGISLLLGHNKKLSHEQVGKLLNEPDDVIRGFHERALVDNPAVKGEHIDHLLRSPNLRKEHIRQLASNPNLQTHHIDALIDDPSTHKELGQNHGATLSFEHQRAIIDSDKAPYGFTQRKDLHPDTVERLLSDSRHPAHHSNLINNEHVPLSDDQLHRLHKNSSIDSGIAGRIFDSPKASSELKNRVFDDHVKQLEAGAGKATGSLSSFVNSKNFTKEHLDKLLDAGDRFKPEGASSSNVFRRYAAEYKKASPAQLDRMVSSSSGDTSMVSNLLDNKNVKPDHLKTMFNTIHKNKVDYHKQKLMDHPSVNSDVLHHVFDNGSNWDRTRVLHHPKVQTSHFQKAMDIGESQHAAVSSSPSAPPSTLSKLADSPYGFIRQNVAGHKNTPSETLSKLANDSSEEVSSIAKKRLKLK